MKDICSAFCIVNFSMVNTNWDFIHQHIHFVKRLFPWKNGKEVHRWGVAEIQKMSP